MGLEEAIELALNDKLTPDAAEAITRAWKDKLAAGEKDDAALKIALREKRIDDALALNHAVMEKMPFNCAIGAGKKYALLTAKDPKAASAYGEELLRTQANAPEVLKSVAYTIFEGSDDRVRGEVKVMIKGEPDYELARTLLLAALECSAPDRKTQEFMKRIQTKQ
jgi:hypothetical protein